MVAHNEQGFTLIELIVSILVVGLLVVALCGFFITERSLGRYTRNTVLAQQAAGKYIELYRNTAFASIPVGTHDYSSALSDYPALRSPRSLTVVVAETEPALLKRVDVTLKYTDNGGEKTCYFSTLIASHGINN